MRVLIVPELYRPDDATANGTLNDAVTWVEQWLEHDESLHVYWLLAPLESANYDREYVLADRERVTLLEAEPYMADSEYGDAFSESGYAERELAAVREGIYDEGGYVDVAIDQRVTGRFDLYKWLLRLGDHETADVQPVELVANVHDLRLPFKRHGALYPNDAPMKTEMAGATVADGVWFKAGVDEERMADYGRDVLAEEPLSDALDDALATGSPLDFERFEESYADSPEWLHVAGSGWGKKNPDVMLDVAETLYEEFGVRTLLTNMDPIVDAFAEREYVRAVPECSRERYERALDRGDIAICASDHETMARTPFEQAASGQVLLLRDRPWIYDCVPEDYDLVADLDDLGALAVRAVERWEEAVAENRRMVEHVRTVRSPERCGRRTYDDLRRRVASRRERVDPGPDLRRALDGVRSVALDELRGRVTDDDGDPVALADLVFGLRALGYRDAGNPGTPVFRTVAERGGGASVAEPGE
ncbi:glycosyltransferase family 1 protein [halophilic archaeon]|nr:glycosyltransferase family 1 protein [halophilic archaeon]